MLAHYQWVRCRWNDEMRADLCYRGLPHQQSLLVSYCCPKLVGSGSEILLTDRYDNSLADPR